MALQIEISPKIDRPRASYPTSGAEAVTFKMAGSEAHGAVTPGTLGKARGGMSKAIPDLVRDRGWQRTEPGSGCRGGTEAKQEKGRPEAQAQSNVCFRSW